ncbi:MAG: methyl-accepting chemotaxis protein, partial [Spirochaetes bacterium]|nr:methyl-accepting chemotaxis protein [Spirochaetota bacterium]
FIRDFKNYKGEIAFLSPCIAKTYEIKDKNTENYINYNITYQKLAEYIDRKKIEIENFPEGNYDEFQAERAVNFSRPGGLKDTLNRDLNLDYKIRKIEGEIVYNEYFAELADNLAEKKEVPIVIDVLNCEKGCNFGPGTLKRITLDETDALINNRIKENQKKYHRLNNFKKELKKLKQLLTRNPFERKYSDKAIEFDPNQFTNEELKSIYEKMKKFEKKDFQDCGSCGYITCEGMAKAILGGLNHETNCYFYVQDLLRSNRNTINDLADRISHLIYDVDERLMSIKITFAEINNSFAITHDALVNSKKSNEVLLKLSKEFTPIVDAITDISDMTHLLSLNAAIEAARAGATGRGFAIVAHEVDKLSSETAEEVEKITPLVKNLISQINQINEKGEKVITDILSVKESYSTFVDTINQLSTSTEELAGISSKIQNLLQD